MKSFVTMEQHICLVCGTAFDTGALFLDKHLRDRFETNTITGYGLCPEHKELFEKDYIALVGVDPAKSTVMRNGNMNHEGAYRTGSIAHLNKDVFALVFNCLVPTVPRVFVEEEVINKLQERMQA